MTPNQRFVRVLQEMPHVERQNRLMSISDREIAVAMMYMEDRDRNRVLAVLSPVKSRRIQEELRLHERLTIQYDDYVKAVQEVMRRLESGQQKSRFKSYLRPRRNVPGTRR